MNETELRQILACGEDSLHQFKSNLTNADSMAAELAAFANSGGGRLFIGVNDDGSVTGLDAVAVRRLNQLLGNAATQNVRPPVHPLTENVQTANGIVMVVSVPDGLSKPYVDNQGRIWVKQGADKRHVTAREEMQRMFQRAGLVYADVVPVAGTSATDIDDNAFNGYFVRRYGQNSEFAGQTQDQLLQNLGLGDGRELNLAGLMLFGRWPQRYRPAFEIKAVAFPGISLADTRYQDSEDIGGTLLEQFKGGFSFIRRNLHHVQRGRGFNTLGELEIPEAALEELLVNALIHRDYFTSASIRVMVFTDRVEIASPGHLPDSLSVESICQGRTNRRNPTLTEHASHILPYRGMGSGIPRALQEWSHIEFLNDVAGNQFSAVIRRPEAEWVDGAPQVTPQVAPQVIPQVTEEVRSLLDVAQGEMKRMEMQVALGLKDRKHFQNTYLRPALDAGLIEMTIPDKPLSSRQKYRLTAVGKAYLSKQHSGGD
jgi:predicted HTH transcriptional regulator